ncbi:selenocysteine-specific translation elongation factor [Dehalobacter sp. DCM]|uniref:selenocysteine-specific translation elongation factor n=1 Tax=Dehalobacter sp. DCM TaxID=2907827 RepID=UPI0030814298|nr:selenocysteine-specific translation elongation factor [Dehalobacter sp. DCM]
MDRFLIIGTAGHVDHGKTQLIQALTGISTDRLKEEKERGISIELGFAYLTLPDGRKAGIIDVPGHEKFVRQMLAGASGMDIVLMIIAADEGVMPQTLEHLAILDILKIQKGIVVLTKVDLVEPEWLDMIEQDTREILKSSFLSDAPYCKVSSITGEGIPNLLETIIKLLEKTEGKRADLPARMPIDRAFSIRGFGTVVTGTLISGTFQKGQEVSIEPGGLTTKIRNIQVHGQQVDNAYAGQRAALNISNLAVDDIQRGANLVVSGHFTVGQVLDVEIYNLPSEKRAIKQRQRIHFHVGTSETLGRIHLLDQEELAPGEKGYAQIILEEPVLAAKGDNFVVRFYSPVTTIGGGTVLGMAALKQKRFKEKVLNEFRIKAEGSISDLIKKELSFPLSLDEIRKKTALATDEINQDLTMMQNDQIIIALSDEGQEYYWLMDSAKDWGNKTSAEVEKYQKNNPLRGGVGREELKKILKIDLPLRKWQLMLEWGYVNQYYRLSSSQVESAADIALPDTIRNQLDTLRKTWEEAGLNPPAPESVLGKLGIQISKFPDYAGFLTTKKIWLSVSGYYFSAAAIEVAKKLLVEYLESKGQITVSEARDCWQTSRKYAVPLLEYFDSINVTQRNGDIRVLS